MPSKTDQASSTTQSVRRQAAQAIGLLRRAAAPDLRHLYWATFWLISPPRWK